MRNNENRISIDDTNAEPEVSTPSIPKQPHQVQQQSANPLLNFVSPTEFVELPSRGKFYPADHPLRDATVIEIKHMTAKEEDILTSIALLKQGKTMDRFLRQIIIDKKINPITLLIGDKNAILVAARKSGYGAKYDTEIICPECRQKSNFEFDLSNPAISKEFVEEEHDNIAVTERGTFIVNLPTTNWSVEVKLLTGADEKRLAEDTEARRKSNLPEETLTMQISSFITSISGVTNRAHINEAISNMPASDSRILRTAYQQIVPNIDIAQTFHCSGCGHSDKMEVPFTTDFFWPQQ